MKIYYVYILECVDGSYYIGITSNLSKRLYEHNIGKDVSAYTFGRRPVILKWYAEFTDVNLAIEKEKQLKGWSRRKKQALIKEDWDKLVKYSKNTILNIEKIRKGLRQDFDRLSLTIMEERRMLRCFFSIKAIGIVVN